MKISLDKFKSLTPTLVVLHVSHPSSFSSPAAAYSHKYPQRVNCLLNIYTPPYSAITKQVIA